jgi:hypothetical protein
MTTGNGSGGINLAQFSLPHQRLQHAVKRTSFHANPPA